MSNGTLNIPRRLRCQAAWDALQKCDLEETLFDLERIHLDSSPRCGHRYDNNEIRRNRPRVKLRKSHKIMSDTSKPIGNRGVADTARSSARNSAVSGCNDKVPDSINFPGEESGSRGDYSNPFETAASDKMPTGWRRNYRQVYALDDQPKYIDLLSIHISKPLASPSNESSGMERRCKRHGMRKKSISAAHSLTTNASNFLAGANCTEDDSMDTRRRSLDSLSSVSTLSALPFGCRKKRSSLCSSATSSTDTIGSLPTLADSSSIGHLSQSD